MKKRNFYIVLTLLFSIFLINSCEKDSDDQPELPPEGAFIMDFSDFQNDPSARKAASELQDPTTLLCECVNYLNAYTTVAVWNTIVTVTMAVPTASYIEAFNHQPEYLGDKSWKWEYSVPVVDLTYTARLIASRISNEEYTAEMYISRDGALGYDDFKWYEGTIRYDRTHAIWTLYESPANPVELLEIEWNMDWEADTSDITYTNVKTGSAEYGSYISFAISDDPVFDASYIVSTSLNTINIEWNRTSKDGRIKNPALYQDDAWHCWDETYSDVICD